jgi:DNA-directed RNA polymerase subunit RPC12/RpoP
VTWLVCIVCHNGRAEQVGKFIVCRVCGSKFRLVKIKEKIKGVKSKYAKKKG